MFVDGGDFDGLCIDFEHVLAFLLFEVFFFGVACPFGELLIVLYEVFDDLLGLFLFFHLYYILDLKFLCRLYFKDLFVIVGLFGVFLLEVALGLLEIPLDFGEFVIAYLEHSIEGMISDGFKASLGDVLFSPFEVSL